MSLLSGSAHSILPGPSNHRMVWVGMGLKDPLVPAPLPWAETFLSAQGGQGPVQPDLEHLQGWGSHSFFADSNPWLPSALISLGHLGPRIFFSWV